MNLKMFITGESKLLGINNENTTLEDVLIKMDEEYAEVKAEYEKFTAYKAAAKENVIYNAPYTQHKINLGLEILDLIQMSILGLKILKKHNVDLKLLFDLHNDKLIDKRKWTIEKEIKINVVDPAENVVLNEFLDTLVDRVEKENITIDAAIDDAISNLTEQELYKLKKDLKNRS